MGGDTMAKVFFAVWPRSICENRIKWMKDYVECDEQPCCKVKSDFTPNEFGANYYEFCFDSDDDDFNDKMAKMTLAFVAIHKTHLPYFDNFDDFMCGLYAARLLPNDVTLEQFKMMPPT